MRRWGVLAALLTTLLARPASSQQAPGDTLPRPAAPADTALVDYLRTLADSTDTFFGASSAPLDTAGLDSVLSFRLAHPDAMRGLRKPRPSVGPWLSFNRADGPLYGGVLTLGRLWGVGALSGRLGWAAGPNEWLGGVAYRRRWGGQRRGAPMWTVEAQGGRFTAVLDPDRHLSWQRVLRAILNGSDRHHYFRRDGVRAEVEHESRSWRLAIGARSELESALPTTATWNLFNNTPRLTENLPATQGRANELSVEGTARLLRLPFQTEVAYRYADAALGSDFDYRRLSVAFGGDLSIGRVAALVPQLQYGRLDGDAIRQASFFLGGTHSLRSLSTNQLGGTRKAFGRLDLLFLPDMLGLARLPHPAFLQLQTAVFAASGAAWGIDPLGGPPVEGGGWPRPETWLSEAGFSLLYRPGLPNPTGFVRVDWARGLGPNRESRISVHYTTPLDLLRPLP